MLILASADGAAFQVQTPEGKEITFNTSASSGTPGNIIFNFNFGGDLNIGTGGKYVVVYA